VNLLEAGLATSQDPAFEVLLGILAQRLNTPPKVPIRGLSSSRSGRRMQRGPSTPPRATGYRAHSYKTPLGLTDWQSRDPIVEDGGINLYEYCLDNPIKLIDPLGLWTWYGNYGGPNWNNGTNRSEQDPIIPPNDPRYKPPIDARDACYQQHDICLNHCQDIKCPAERQKCRHACDNALSTCLQNVSPQTGTMPYEEWLFGGKNTPNNNPNPH